jgi:hypothetical protein
MSLLDSDTLSACRSVSSWSTRGQKIVTPEPNGQNITTTGSYTPPTN